MARCSNCWCTDRDEDYIEVAGYTLCSVCYDEETLYQSIMGEEYYCYYSDYEDE